MKDTLAAIGVILLFVALVGVMLSGANQKPCKITHYRQKTDGEVIRCQMGCKYSCMNCMDPAPVCE